MRRDNMTMEEAQALVESTKSEIADAIACGDFDLVEDLMYGDLGLEMDYIDQLIWKDGDYYDESKS